MPSRRPGLRRSRGVAALAVVLLAGCSGPGPVPVTVPTPADPARCAALLGALPDRLAGQDARPVEPASAAAAAWGDPAIVLECGAYAVPPTASCAETDGVGWYIPEAAFADQSRDVVLTTIGRTPAVRVTVPATYRPPAAVMVGLAGPIKDTLRQDSACV